MKSNAKSLASLSAAAGAAGLLTWATMRRKSWIDLAGKVVVITGGSRGLGLALAREFGSRGATIVICARDEAELERAADDLRQRGTVVHTIRCDVADRNQSEQLINETFAKLGAIDVLVNNAGVIQVGPLSAMTVADFENAMNVMFWGTLYPTLAALPYLLSRPQARIVNITSIGGKISVPHLLPYCCAKFAAVAFSEGLRAELSPRVKVTTVVPGLMRTGSHLNALFKGDHAKEYAWFSLGAATPVVSISAERAARAIVKSAIRGDAERILSVPADLAARFHGAAPGLTSALSSLVTRVLPKGNGDQILKSGAEAREKLKSTPVDRANWMGQRAAESLNQLS